MTPGGVKECAGCGKRITERWLLKALDLFWHEDCLKCGCCDCRLGEVGSTLYTKANLILCKRDYLRYDTSISQIITIYLVYYSYKRVSSFGTLCILKYGTEMLNNNFIH